jgi:predicted RNase H-like HicB family nuclease
MINLKTQYAAVNEQVENNYSSFVPALRGYVATGAKLEEIEAEIREAIAFQIDGMRESGLAISEPTSKVEYIDLVARRRGGRRLTRLHSSSDKRQRR